MNSRIPTRMLALGLALLIAVPAWPVGARLAPELPDPGHPGMSREKQEQLGLKTAAEVYKLMPVLPDSNPVTQYIQRLGNKLVAVIPRERSWPYQFHVIQQSDINAFALPGGPIFINIGTINAADNEAQLAGVLSHEMSHVYMQHSAKQAPKQEWASILGALGGLLGGTAGDLAEGDHPGWDDRTVGDTRRACGPGRGGPDGAVGDDGVGDRAPTRADVADRPGRTGACRRGG